MTNYHYSDLIFYPDSFRADYNKGENTSLFILQKAVSRLIANKLNIP